MSGYMQSAMRHRLTAPAWSVAVALLDGANQQLAPTAPAAAAPPQSTRATAPPQDAVCLDNHIVGHC
jgi:hypothetical protein